MIHNNTQQHTTTHNNTHTHNLPKYVDISRTFCLFKLNNISLDCFILVVKLRKCAAFVMAFFFSLVRLLVIVMSRQPFRSNVTHDRTKVEVCAFNTRSSCQNKVAKKNRQEKLEKKNKGCSESRSESCRE